MTKNHIPSKPLDRPIPVRNVDGTENQAGDITTHVDVPVEIKGRIKRIPLLVTSLGQETVMLGYPWLKKENPNIDWEKQILEWRNWRKKDISIQLKISTPTENQELVISYIKGTLTDQAREDWMKTHMYHSQLFALEEEKAKIKPKEEIVPKISQIPRYSLFRKTSWKTTTKNEVRSSN